MPARFRIAATMIFLTLLLAPAIASADVAPGPGRCSCQVTNNSGPTPLSGALVLMVGAVTLLWRRRP